MAASLGVYGRVDHYHPIDPSRPDTASVGVVGEGFPPNAGVGLKVEEPPLQRGARADANGSFVWEETSTRLRIGEGDTLNVVATYQDPTDPDGSSLTVQGKATVQYIEHDDGHPGR